MSKEPISHTLLRKHLDEFGLRYETEVKFHPSRRWRWDFTIPEELLAIEIMGKTWSQGRHTRGQGYQNDCEKSNEGVRLGWRIIRFTSEEVLSGKAKEFLDRFFGGACSKKTS